MATDTFKMSNVANSAKYGYGPSTMPTSQQSPFDASMNQYTSENKGARSDTNGDHAIMIRKLAQSTSQDQIESMLIFAQDLLSVDFMNDNDGGFKTAIARFSKPAAAQNARDMLNGKPNAARDAAMIVEVISLSPGGTVIPRRGTLEQRDTGSADSSAFNSNPPHRQSKFNGTFQALDRVSPPRSNFSNGDMPKQDSYPSYFSPTSPIGQPLERQRVSGKSVISEDVADDETGKLIDDPVGYAKTNGGGSIRAQSNNLPRRSTLPQLPTQAFQSLNIGNTGMTSPPIAGMTSPKNASMMNSMYGSSNMSSMGPNAPYQLVGQTYMRPTFPPINPSDQNPPCNTLYVGNLPMDTSEDELKQMFIKQRGYKRLCFRTKSNGPMCFVEFEDITTASKALTECYGMPLHNSTKGGIRLSFSKNPLGVRGGQPGSMGMTSPISPSPMSGMNGYGGMQSYSSVSGPPPGLNPPPGLPSINTTNGHSINGAMNGMTSPIGTTMGGPFSNPMSPVGGTGMNGLRSPTSSGGPTGWPTGQNAQTGQLPDYMLGR